MPKIGASWIKEKDGKKFLSCVIQTPLLELNFAMFKNDDKTSDNQPDYNIVWSPVKAKQESVDSSTVDTSGDDIAF